MSDQQPDEVEVKFAGNIRRLRMRPGDVLVFEIPAGITPEQVGLLLGAMKEKFPGNEIVALGGGIRAAAVLSGPRVAIAGPGTNGFLN